MRFGHSAVEEFFRGSKSVRLKTGRAQQPFYGAAEARVILYNRDGTFEHWHVSPELPPNVAHLLTIWLLSLRASCRNLHRPPLLAVNGHHFPAPTERAPSSSRGSAGNGTAISLTLSRT